jgi:hypothetical protein
MFRDDIYIRNMFWPARLSLYYDIIKCLLIFMSIRIVILEVALYSGGKVPNWFKHCQIFKVLSGEASGCSLE